MPVTVSCAKYRAWKCWKVALCAFENELGVQAPVGFWDPVGFTSDGDVAAFKRRRSVELKHGRISMMATMGALTAARRQCNQFSLCFADPTQHTAWHLMTNEVTCMGQTKYLASPWASSS